MVPFCIGEENGRTWMKYRNKKKKEEFKGEGGREG